MVERRVRDAEAASSNLVASMMIGSPETLRNQGFRGFFISKGRGRNAFHRLSPLEPLGFFYHVLIVFEPLFEPLLFQLCSCLFEINGVGIIFFAYLLVIP